MNRRGEGLTAADWVVRRDAGMTPGEQREYEAWLDAEPRRRGEVERLTSTWMALGLPLRAGRAPDLLREIAHWQKRRRWRRWSMTASASAAALILGALALPSRRSALVAIPPRSGPTTIVSEPAERTLPDGSTIDLKDDAEIAVEFGRAVRTVVLRRGEALFHVAKDRLHPFVVLARGVEVHAVGTAFSVQLGRDDVEILVAEGRVALNRTSAAPSGEGAPPPALAFVDAGNRAVVDALPRSTLPPRISKLPKAELAERLAWSEPRLEFSGTPLPEALELMNRHNRVRLVIADPSLKAVRVSGFIRALNIEGFVSMLEGSFGIKADRPGQAEILLRRDRPPGKP